MKIFGGDAITRVFNTLGVDEGMPIDSKMISSSVENAQKKVEGRNFTIRKNVLKYDDVMNVQREIIYKQRKQVLDGENLSDTISKMIDTVAENTILAYCYENTNPSEINISALSTEIRNTFGAEVHEATLEFIKQNLKDSNKLIEKLKDEAHKQYAVKEQEIGSNEIRELERVVMLKVVDQKWMDHIDSMDELKNGIGLRAYGQKDPVVQYRIEGFDMFEQMIEDIKVDVVKMLMNLRKQEEARREEAVKITGAALKPLNSLDTNGQKVQNTANADVTRTVVNDGPKVGRNDPCPCGSGKKYKNCCGKN